MAYGIDKVLEPPNIGAHCDDFTAIEIKVSNQCKKMAFKYYHIKMHYKINTAIKIVVCLYLFDYM